jgi:predicted nucleic acid-binding protein
MPPTRLYLDTNVCIAYLVGSHPHNVPARVLFRRLAECGLTTLFVSSLSWLEFAHVVARQEFLDHLPEDWRRRYRLTRWQDASVRRQYLEALVRHLADLLDEFEWVELPLTPDVRTAAIDYLKRYAIDAQDAVHLASATLAGVQDLASFDRRLRHIDDLYLWNDLMYTNS